MKDVMKEKDQLILSLLRADARMSLTDMSRKTRMPISTIYDKIKSNSGTVIKKTTCIIDFRELGFNARANVMLRVRRDQREKLMAFLTKHANVNSLFRINNGYDLMVEGIFKNVADLELFLDTIEDRFRVKEKQVYYIIEDIKREGFMADFNPINA